MIGQNFSLLSADDQKHEIMALCFDVYSGKIPLGVITIKHPIPDGAIKHADHYLSAMKNAGGEIIGFHCVGIDATDRVHAEEAMRASEEKYRMVLNVGAIGYYEIDLKGNVLYCNESVLSNMGYSSEELIGKSFSVVTTKEQKHEIMALFGDVYSGKISLGVITVKHPRTQRYRSSIWIIISV